MQRSRRALLQRKAALDKVFSGRKNWFKVSLSVFLASWGLVFLLSTLISRGNSYQDANAVSEVTDKETWNKIETDRTLGAEHVPKYEEAENFEPVKQNGSIKESQAVQENVESQSPIDQQENESVYLEVKEEKSNLTNSNRLSLGLPLTFDEFKNKAIAAKEKPAAGQAGGIVHRLEPGGKEYNYASASRGSKILASNKEAKGASNILGKDQDKYLRNPCSAEKHLIIELSEETLVSTIEIANFEHYSSNLKDFELFTSLVYPTDNWDFSGNFTAANVKHEQRFDLHEPRWARYLKINLLSHYGSEFYCTLSLLEVYGVDAVEKMLEDLISTQDNHAASDEPTHLLLDPNNENDLNLEQPTDSRQVTEQEYTIHEISKTITADSTLESRPSQVGRMPGDTVLKILMQKIRLLDVNLAILEKYLDEMNGRYGQLLKDADKETADKNLILEQIAVEMHNLSNNRDTLYNDIEELFGWKDIISSKLDRLNLDNKALRSQVEAIRINQVDLELRGFVATSILFVFCFIAAFKLTVNLLLSICQKHSSVELCSPISGWFLVLLTCGMMAFILAS